MRQVKEIFDDNTMHIEQRFGTQEQAINYCKKNGEYYEFGEPCYLCKRNDIKNLIDEFKTIEEVKYRYTHVYCVYRNWLKDICNDKMIASIPEVRYVDVYAYIGKTGSGKTYKAITENAGNYFKLTCHDTNLSFDGYNGEKVLIIDEFYGWIKYNFFLQVLDVYKLCIPVKGGFTYDQLIKVIITSNKAVSEWYPNVRDQSALNRWIKETTIVFGDDTINSNQNVITGVVDGWYFNDPNIPSLVEPLTMTELFVDNDYDVDVTFNNNNNVDN